MFVTGVVIIFKRKTFFEFSLFLFLLIESFIWRHVMCWLYKLLWIKRSHLTHIILRNYVACVLIVIWRNHYSLNLWYCSKLIFHIRSCLPNIILRKYLLSHVVRILNLTLYILWKKRFWFKYHLRIFFLLIKVIILFVFDLYGSHYYYLIY